MAIALLLLAAAGLKGYELATVPLQDRAWLIAQIVVEWLVGVWLLAGIYRRAAWAVALGLFCTFSGVAAQQALARNTTCGCFGPAQLDPRYTLALDLAVVGALVITGRTLRRPARPPEWQLMIASAAFVVGIGIVVFLIFRGLPPLARPLWIPPNLATTPSS